MCPTQRLMQDRGCAGDCVISPNVVKNTILTVTAVVVVFASLDFWLHLIEFTLIAVGALTVGYVAGYVWLRRVIPARRAQAQALGTEWAARSAMRQSAAQQFPAHQQALPQGQEVHQHVHFHGAEAMQQWQDRQR
jgi:hypothetical protein